MDWFSVALFAFGAYGVWRLVRLMTWRKPPVRHLPSCDYRLAVAGDGRRNGDGRNRQAIIKSLAPGEVVTFEPEPTNPADPDAIKVMTRLGQIGYVPRKNTRWIHDWMRLGKLEEAWLDSIEGGTFTRPNVGAVIGLRQKVVEPKPPTPEERIADAFPGVGPVLASSLIAAGFDAPEAIGAASDEELLAVKGLGKARLQDIRSAKS